MTRRHVISHHLFRRTARERMARIRIEQELAHEGVTAAQLWLRQQGLDADTRLTVESTIRGPFGWQVVAL